HAARTPHRPFGAGRGARGVRGTNQRRALHRAAAPEGLFAAARLPLARVRADRAWRGLVDSAFDGSRARRMKPRSNQPPRTRWLRPATRTRVPGGLRMRAVSLILIVIGFTGASAALPDTVVVSADRMVDVQAGRAVSKPQVTVTDGRIAAIGTQGG